jgi:hypothetical protein
LKCKIFGIQLPVLLGSAFIEEKMLKTKNKKHLSIQTKVKTCRETNLSPGLQSIFRLR